MSATPLLVGSAVPTFHVVRHMWLFATLDCFGECGLLTIYKSSLLKLGKRYDPFRPVEEVLDRFKHMLLIDSVEIEDDMMYSGRAVFSSYLIEPELVGRADIEVRRSA